MDHTFEMRVDHLLAGRWGSGDLCQVLPSQIFRLPLMAAGDDDDG